jgi:adenylate cyclase
MGVLPRIGRVAARLLPRQGLPGIAVTALALAAWILLRLFDPLPLVALRNLAFDQFQRTYPRIPAEYSVVIVDIDEKSLRELGQWPWQRTVLADIVDRLHTAGAAAIGFDVLFAEPDRLSPGTLARTMRTDDQAIRDALAALPDSDAAFASALARAPAVLGQSGSPSATVVRAADDIPRASIATLGGDPRSDVLTFPYLLTNLPALERAAKGRGLFSVGLEGDGVIRRIPLIAWAGDRLVPALSVEVIRVATGGRTTLVKRDEAGVRSVVLAGVEVPTDRSGQLWLHFGPHAPSRYIPAVDILKDPKAAETVAGKIVLVGTSAVGLFDLRTTPVEPIMPGVEVHAQAIESILTGASLERPNYATGAEVSLAFVVAMAIMFSIPRFGARATLLLGTAMAVAIAGLSWLLFTQARFLLDMTFPLLAGGTIYLLLTFRNYVREERQRTVIRDAFRQYLSAEMVERLVKEPDRLVLGGETRNLTVMFTDFRGFTAVAERFKSNPAGLTRLMNRLLSPLSHAIIDQRGTIDKYMGDAIMAFWNAPLDDEDHAYHACVAALDIVHRLDRLNAELLAEAENTDTPISALKIGLGVASGLNVVGNMGSDIRFDYTVMGDSVNVASRLQGMTRSIGLRILVSEATAAAVQGRLACLEIEQVVLKGRKDPERIHALVGGEDVTQRADFGAFAAAHARFLAHVAAERQDEAAAEHAACRELAAAETSDVVAWQARRLAQPNDPANRLVSADEKPAVD